MKRFLFITVLALLLTPGGLLAQDAQDLPSWVSVHFSTPTGSRDASTYANGPDTILAAAMDDARQSIDVAAFELNSPAITQALLNAHDRGVVVRIVTDDEAGLDVSIYEEAMDAEDEEEREELLEELEEDPEDTTLDELYDAGIPIVDDDRSALMHNKFVIIDSATVWTGSMNMTINGSYRNNNNLVSIRGRRMVENYQTEFDEMFVDHKFGPTSPENTPNPQLTIDGTALEVYFTSEDDVLAALMREVEAAQESIRFMSFSFTLTELGEAMSARGQEGVTVQGVFETVGSETKYSALTPLYCGGFDARQDANPFILHHKVIIIDDETVLTGSFNFSNNATRSNDENLVIIRNAAVAALFLEEFWLRYYEASIPDRIRCREPRPVLAGQQCRVAADDANVRGGPSTDYPLFGHLIDNAALNVDGLSQDGRWFAVEYGDLQGWVVGSAAKTSGMCDGLATVPAWDCNGNLYNCSDFATCEEAMGYFLACPGDPSRLDVDGDGTPCTSLCGS